MSARSVREDESELKALFQADHQDLSDRKCPVSQKLPWVLQKPCTSYTVAGHQYGTWAQTKNEASLIHRPINNLLPATTKHKAFPAKPNIVCVIRTLWWLSTGTSLRHAQAERLMCRMSHSGQA